MLISVPEQDRLVLNKQFIHACRTWNCFLAEDLIHQNMDHNYQYYDEIKREMLPYKGSTPLIVILNSGSYTKNIGRVVQLLLKKGANPSVMDNLANNALYYAICLVRRSRYPQRKTSTSEVEIVRDIVFHMESENLDTKIRDYTSIPNEYTELSPLEFALRRDFGSTSSQQFEAAEILLNADANPNSVDKKLINSLLKFEMMYQLDFFMLFLAKGLKLDKDGEEILKENIILKFFVLSEVEFCGFFQNVKDDTELIDGLIKIRKCVRHKAQELAFNTWLRYGTNEISSKGDIVERFLIQKTGKDLIPVCDELLHYLDSDSIVSLFFASVLLRLQKSFVEKHEKEISELFKIPIRNTLNLDKYVDEKFTKKRKGRERNKELSTQREESLYDIRFLYGEPFCLSEEESEGHKFNSPSKNNMNSWEICIGVNAIISFTTGLLVACFIRATVSTPRYVAALVLIGIAIVGTLVGAAVSYGIIKFCEKVSEEKSKDPSMAISTAIKNVLTPECLKSSEVIVSLYIICKLISSVVLVIKFNNIFK